ncbi:MAG: sel1 repeat family protein [Methylobacillus sp.]|jgi:TPR repeat protein|nr:sel1 repeat family protein [Methylobacillus sp.]
MKNAAIALLLTLCCALALAACDRERTPEEREAVAREILHEKAGRGDVRAQFRLGVIYELDGRGDEAEKWYQKAAEQGHPDAQYNLARRLWMSFDDTGKERAAKWFAEAAAGYRKAAEQGNARAQYYLGDMYSSAEGVAQDPAQAAFWFRKSADKENADAQVMIGEIYERGWENISYPQEYQDWKSDDYSQDYAKAAEWYRKAAEQGNPTAQARLGTLYYFGRGVAEDREQSARWMEKSREKKTGFFDSIMPIHDMEPDGAVETPETSGIINATNKLNTPEGTQK